MRVVVIGASGTIGSAVVEALRGSHDVVPASRTGDLRVDLDDSPTVAALFERENDADAVVCCAASAPLRAINDVTYEEFINTISGKLLGQIGLAIHACRQLKEGGSITLTSGDIPENTQGSAGGALVNAGLEAFVRAAALDLGQRVRINVVRPGWVAETLSALGMDATHGTPARDLARVYVAAVEGTMRGEVLRPGS